MILGIEDIRQSKFRIFQQNKNLHYMNIESKYSKKKFTLLQFLGVISNTNITFKY